MLVPNDRRNDAVQDLLPDALNGTDRAADDHPLPSSNDGFRPELPFLTSCLNGLGWSKLKRNCAERTAEFCRSFRDLPNELGIVSYSASIPGRRLGLRITPGQPTDPRPTRTSGAIAMQQPGITFELGGGYWVPERKSVGFTGTTERGRGRVPHHRRRDQGDAES